MENLNRRLFSIFVCPIFYVLSGWDPNAVSDEDAYLQKRLNRLKRLGYGQMVHGRWGDGYKGWPEHAPYNAIIVTTHRQRSRESLSRK